MAYNLTSLESLMRDTKPPVIRVTSIRDVLIHNKIVNIGSAFSNDLVQGLTDFDITPLIFLYRKKYKTKRSPITASYGFKGYTHPSDTNFGLNNTNYFTGKQGFFNKNTSFSVDIERTTTWGVNLTNNFTYYPIEFKPWEWFWVTLLDTTIVPQLTESQFTDLAYNLTIDSFTPMQYGTKKNGTLLYKNVHSVYFKFAFAFPYAIEPIHKLQYIVTDLSSETLCVTPVKVREPHSPTVAYNYFHYKVI